jgi:radical SAM superfamily enzyme YgiQ (UPF0313 family)
VKLALITAATVTEFSDVDEINSQTVRTVASEPQLGVLSIAAVLSARGDTVHLVDLNRIYLEYVANDNRPRLNDFARVAAEVIVTSHADLYGFGSICSSYPLTVRIARAVKELCPASIILFGGPQASVVDTGTLQAFGFVDLILRGEAECSLSLLLDQLVGSRRFEEVAGLTYRRGSRVIRNSNAPLILDLDSLPLPAYHLLEDFGEMKRIPLEVGRGCPFACTFCSTNDFFRRRFRLRSPGRVIADMRKIAKAYSFRRFDLVHDMFTVDRRLVVAFCNAMSDSGEQFTWSCSARTDSVDEELLELMARSGCDGIFLGVESGSPRMQKIINKHLDVERARDVIKVSASLGFRTTVSLITGFPEEEREDVTCTLNLFTYSARFPSCSPQLNLLAPLAATPSYLQYKEKLVLRELCSDISHQARLQHQEDVDLIQAYPNIFPNFYLLPTPHLDDGLLLELREFMLLGAERFRWLLVAIGQASSDILNFIEQWRAYRMRVAPGLRGPALRQFYRCADFVRTFKSFLESHPVGTNDVVKACLEFYHSFDHKLMKSETIPTNEFLLPAGSRICWSDRPVKASNIGIFSVSCDMQKIVELLKTNNRCGWERDPHFYMSKAGSEGEVFEISDWMFNALCCCDGTRNIRGVIMQLWDCVSEIAEVHREYLLVELIKRMVAEGFVKIYRDRAVRTAAENCLGEGSAYEGASA